MKSYLFILVLALVTAFTMPAFAGTIDDDTPTQPVAGPLSAEDTTAVRTVIQEASKLFDVTPTPAPTPNKSASTSGKSPVDVADRALDMIGNMVSVVAQKVEQAAPEVYRIMVLQQLAEAASTILIWGGLFLFALIVQRKLGKREDIPRWEAANTDSEKFAWMFGRGIPGFCVGLFGVLGTIQIGGAIKMVVNPQYYAIRDLLQMILHSQTPPM